MKEKNIVDVIIAGRRYKLSGYETTEYIHRVAAYINSKYDEFKTPNLQSREMRSVLVSVNLTDELFKKNEEIDQIKREFEETDRKVFDLKHELASTKDALEKQTEKVRELTEQLNRMRRR